MADDEAVPSFDDPAKEASYWRLKATDLQDMLREAESSLKEFAESSKELEVEMERELAQLSKDLDSSRIKNEKLGQDKDEWKNKYQASLLEHNKTLAEMTREVTQLSESRNVYKNKLRDMELDNDELENAERMIRSTLADIEGRYNSQMERVTLMEGEIIEKQRMEEEVQRMRDEIRELNEEIAILRHRDGSRAPSARNDTPQGDEMTLQELSINKNAASKDVKESQSYADDLKATVRGESSSSVQSPSSSSRVPAGLKTPSAPRSSIAHARRGSRDIRGDTASKDSPAFRPRQSFASSRSAAAAAGARNPRTPARPGAQAGSSMRMMRDLNANMAALRSRINNAVGQTPAKQQHFDDAADRSCLPRPSSRVGNSPLGASTATVTARTGPRPSFDGKSSIPVSSLSRSLRRPTSRLSNNPHISAVKGGGDLSPPPSTSSVDRATTPTNFTARARLQSSQVGPSGSFASDKFAAHAASSRPTSSLSGSTADRYGAASPLDFLNTEPVRPGSRAAHQARESLMRRRESVSNRHQSSSSSSTAGPPPSAIHRISAVGGFRPKPRTSTAPYDAAADTTIGNVSISGRVSPVKSASSYGMSDDVDDDLLLRPASSTSYRMSRPSSSLSHSSTGTGASHARSASSVQAYREARAAGTASVSASISHAPSSSVSVDGPLQSSAPHHHPRSALGGVTASGARGPPTTYSNWAKASGGANGATTGGPGMARRASVGRTPLAGSAAAATRTK